MRKVAVITGATSGIGRDFARSLGERGYDLIITGRRENLIKKVAEDIEKEYRVKVEVHILDLTEEKSFNDFVNYLEKRNDIEFLVNNAGHGAKETFTEDTYENQLSMIKIHILATTKLCHSIVKQMKKRGKGYIINTSSIASFNTFPTSAMYCATKGYITSFTQSLAMELSKYNIKVQALCPGFTRTDFHEKLEMDEGLLKNKGIARWMTSKDVVDISLKNIDKNLKVIVVPGFFNKMMYVGNKFIPRKLYYKFAVKGWDLMK